MDVSRLRPFLRQGSPAGAGTSCFLVGTGFPGIARTPRAAVGGVVRGPSSERGLVQMRGCQNVRAAKRLGWRVVLVGLRARLDGSAVKCEDGRGGR